MSNLRQYGIGTLLATQSYEIARRIAVRPLLFISLLLTMFWIVSPCLGQVIGKRGTEAGVFTTPIAKHHRDTVNDLEWLDGKSRPAEGDTTKRIIWTRDSAPHHHGTVFGAERSIGVRHLRLGLKGQVRVGSVLMRGNSRLSVLKPHVQGPGDPADDSQWIPAERIDGRTITTSDPQSNALVVWVLPPNTKTRALRLSHEPQVADNKYEGIVAGLYVMAGRFADLSSQSRVQTSANPKEAGLLIDGHTNKWGYWDNGNSGAEQAVSPASPEWVQLNFPEPVVLRGLNMIAGGVRNGVIKILPQTAPSPAKAKDSDWRDARSYEGTRDFYPSQLRPGFLDLGADVKVRAVRLVMTQALDAGTLHPHLKKGPVDGKRVWLDELQALMPLGNKPLASAILKPWAGSSPKPPIAVKFHLDEPGNVTLVIEDRDGKRVRNLISQTPYPAGDNVAWWDGLDDLGRDVDAAKHGLYHVPGSLVAPGTYTVRGLVAPPIALTYEISVDQAGSPPWPTADNRGGWGTNHSAPSCVAVCPADRNDLNRELVFIGSYVAEGGHGLFWIDLDANKHGGKHWLGGHWTGAQTVVGDVGSQADTDTAVYVASGFQGEVRFVALSRSFRERILGKYRLVPQVKGNPNDPAFVGDLAVHNELIVASMPRTNALWFFDAGAGKLLGKIDIDAPNAVAFTKDGVLLATSGSRMLRIEIDRKTLAKYPAAGDPKNLPVLDVARTTTLPMTLDHPHGITVMDNGRIAVTEQGKLNQVRIYTRQGRFMSTLGDAGPVVAGPYNPKHMNRPDGLAVDSRGRFWVAENSTQPKRVSLWDRSGGLARAWYGPSRYGGGGTLDPDDRTRFYNAGMQFKIDWDTGDVQVERIMLLKADAHGGGKHDSSISQFPPKQHHSNGMPEQIYRVNGRTFFTNWHNSNPTNGTSTAVIWEDDGDKLIPVVAFGSAYNWWVTESDAFKSRWPEGTPHRKKHAHPVYFMWQDTNGNGVMEPRETVFKRGRKQGVTVMPDLSFVTVIDDKVVRFPAETTSDGLHYDFDHPTVLMSGAQRRASTGGSTYMLMPDDRVMAFPPPKPYSRYSIGGGPAGGEPDWSYPNMWPGLHASHHAATPQFPGMLIGPTRVMGPPVTPRNSDIGPLWFVNANMGCMYAFTSDGLFVATLFHDSRIATRWRMPLASRGMRVDHLTLGDETFWPTVTQLQGTGEIYLSVGIGSASTLVKVDGLDKAKRIPPKPLVVDNDQLRDCLAWQTQAEQQRLAQQGPKRLRVKIANQPVKLDGRLDEWVDADWATIDQRGTKANFNSNAMPYDVSAAMKVVGNDLYIAWRTTEPKLLANSGELAIAPFKTGGCLDLMIRSTATGRANHTQSAAGDQRLIITRRAGGDADGELWAVHYRANVPGTASDDRVAFASPVQTIHIDAVDDVSGQVQLAQDQGNYEARVPLALLGIRPKAGMTVKGDVGILRGSVGVTRQRVYWSNKATTITADVPSEAKLQSNLWGTLTFE